MAVPEGATKLGTVGIAYKGVYDELVTYKYANAVYYNGSTYIALIDNPAGFPSNDGVNWRYLAQGFLQQAVSALTVIDESGILGVVDAEVNAQEFLSKIAELEQGLEDTKANKADILGTLEEIVANTEGGRIAGALAVKELNSNLKKYAHFKDISVDTDSEGNAPIGNINGVVPLSCIPITIAVRISSILCNSYGIYYIKTDVFNTKITVRVLYTDYQ